MGQHAFREEGGGLSSEAHRITECGDFIWYDVFATYLHEKSVDCIKIHTLSLHSFGNTMKMSGGDGSKIAGLFGLCGLYSYKRKFRG